MTNLIRKPIQRFRDDLWINLIKLLLFVLAILDQFKGFFNIFEPYNHYLSVLSRYIIFFFIVEFQAGFINGNILSIGRAKTIMQQPVMFVALYKL